ncbi:MAG: helix-turn-helix transcriptional regulator, partial [Clostridia bacterium]|nr:helix-turn-helix transcriptional regulator [Clostridia bacterium]
MSIGEKIRDLRKSKNMTQEDLAECLNVTISAVSQWEIGKTMPDITMIPIICNVFDVSSDKLLEIDLTKKNIEIENVRTEAGKYYTRGFVLEGKEILKQGLLRFPNNYG